MIFVGAATKPAMEEAVRTYQARYGVSVQATYAGSGTLLTQIVTEHTGDVYIPGADDYMQKALAKGAVIPATIRTVAYLVPAICVPKGNPKHIRGLRDLTRPGLRVVLGQKGAVCLGDVADSILTSAGLAAQVRKQVASYGLSCEEVCNALLLGEADAVIAWDVYARQYPDKIESIPISKPYLRVRTVPGAVIKWTKNRQAAEAFLAFLTSASGKQIFAKHHYTVEPPK
jgi:molybdate transport system substrate-binding protein